ncbi:MAG: hypothetical protein JSW52_09550 [Candidatus Coatesbacteria bacterium]|nr:MAG: hypothetical protein JSW52_09550 [Candidatus Coatesbacteria bacterium]
MAKNLTPDVLRDNCYTIVELPLGGMEILDVVARPNGDYLVEGDVFDLCGGERPDDLTTLKVQLDQPSADFKAVTTKKTDFTVGVNFLEKFLSVFAAIPALGDIGAAFNAGFGGAASIEMTYSNVLQDFIDPMKLTPLVENKTCGPNVYDDLKKSLRKGRGGIIAGCLKSNGFSVQAFDEKGRNIAPEISVFKQLAGVEVGVECQKEGETAVTFTGEVPQLFAYRALRLKLTDKGVLKLRRSGKRAKSIGAPEPRFLWEEFPEDRPVVVHRRDE